MLHAVSCHSGIFPESPVAIKIGFAALPGPHKDPLLDGREQLHREKTSARYRTNGVSACVRIRTCVSLHVCSVREPMGDHRQSKHRNDSAPIPSCHPAEAKRHHTSVTISISGGRPQTRQENQLYYARSSCVPTQSCLLNCVTTTWSWSVSKASPWKNS